MVGGVIQANLVMDYLRESGGHDPGAMVVALLTAQIAKARGFRVDPDEVRLALEAMVQHGLAETKGPLFYLTREGRAAIRPPA